MAEVNRENTTVVPIDQTKRQLLTVAAGGVIAALAIPSTVAASAADPIFAAIDEQAAAHEALHSYYDKWFETHDNAAPQDREIGFALSQREINARNALLATVPTTLAGVQALRRHWLDDAAKGDESKGYANMCGYSSRRTVRVAADGTVEWEPSGHETLERMLAQRARELAAR